MIGGELVHEARRRAAMTQGELAERARTTQSAIARLESGRTSPSLEQVQRLMRLCGFDLRVELVPYDDSDLVQSRELRDLTVEQRIDLNAATVRQAEEFRQALKDVQRA